MKNAVQELFSKLEIEHPNLFNTNTLEGRQFINDYYPFLEMEKQQIINSYADGYSDSDNSFELNKDYYNEKFKNK